jgi:hypothetical protein
MSSFIKKKSVLIRVNSWLKKQSQSRIAYVVYRMSSFIKKKSVLISVDSCSFVVNLKKQSQIPEDGRLKAEDCKLHLRGLVTSCLCG